MKTVSCLILAGGILFSSVNFAGAQDAVQKLPEGKPMTPENAIAAAVPMGQKGTIEKVPVEGRSFKEALRITVSENCTNFNTSDSCL